ncbi:hypothetical protein [Microbacterium sp. HJ5]
MANVTPAFASMPRVNLLPKSEIARREREVLTRKWAWGVLAAMLIALLLIGGAFFLKLTADQRLAAEQARTNDLLVELAALSGTSEALATEAELTAFRTEAMATDVGWQPVVDSVENVLPTGVSLTGFELTVGSMPGDGDPATAAGLTGLIRLDSPTPVDIVDVVRSLRAVEGVLEADGQAVTSSTSEAARYAYLLTVTFDQTVYTGEYAPVAEEE